MAAKGHIAALTKNEQVEVWPYLKSMHDPNAKNFLNEKKKI